MAVVIVVFQGFISWWRWHHGLLLSLFNNCLGSILKHGHIDLIITALVNSINLYRHFFQHFLLGLVALGRYQVDEALVMGRAFLDRVYFVPDTWRAGLRDDFHWLLINLRIHALLGFGTVGRRRIDGGRRRLCSGRAVNLLRTSTCLLFIEWAIAAFARGAVLLLRILSFKHFLKRICFSSLVRLKISLNIIVDTRVVLLLLAIVLLDSIQLAFEILGLTRRQLVVLAQAVENVGSDEYALHTHVQIDAHLMIIIGSVVFYRVGVQSH